MQSQIIKGMNDGTHPLKGFEGLVFALDESTMTGFFITMFDSECDLIDDSNGATIETILNGYGGDIKIETLMATNGIVDVFLKEGAQNGKDGEALSKKKCEEGQTQLERFVRPGSALERGDLERNEGSGMCYDRTSSGALFLTAGRSLLVQADWKAEDSEKQGEECPTLDSNIEAMMTELAPQLKEQADFMGSVVFKNCDLSRSLSLNLYKGAEGDSSDPLKSAITTFVEGKTDNHILEDTKMYLVVDKDGLGHGHKSSLALSAAFNREPRRTEAKRKLI